VYLAENWNTKHKLFNLLFFWDVVSLFLLKFSSKQNVSLSIFTMHLVGEGRIFLIVMMHLVPSHRSHNDIILALDTFFMARYRAMKKCPFALTGFQAVPLGDTVP
jgi:hypothetical protein